MQLSEQTKKILENYATISTGIFIPASTDNQTEVMACERNLLIIAKTKVKEVISNDICISDLKAFLSTISALNNPDIKLQSDHMVISDGAFNVRLMYGDPVTMTRLKKPLDLPTAKHTFTLKDADRAKLLNLASILDLPHLKLYGENGKLYVQVLDRANPSTNTGAVEVGTGDFANGEEYFIKRELLKIIPGDYEVSIILTAKTGLSLFQSLEHTDLSYVIALDGKPLSAK